jgi:hypothetical protein
VRRIFVRLAILVTVLVGLSILWIAAGRQISLAIDRFKTIETRSIPIKTINYEGSGTDGTLHFGDLALSLTSPQSDPRLSIGTTKDNQLALSFVGKVFPFGPLRDNSENLATDAPADDRATISLRHSLVAWPTPFDFNFMTGQSPAWRRNLYHELHWEKPNGSKLEMVWRYEEYLYSGNGWVGAPMTRENSTGLIRVEISNPVR